MLSTSFYPGSIDFRKSSAALPIGSLPITMEGPCRTNVSKKVENDEQRVEQDKVGWQEKKKTKTKKKTTKTGRRKRKKAEQGKVRKKDSQVGWRQECQCVGLLPLRQRCLEAASLSATINNSPSSSFLPSTSEWYLRRAYTRCFSATL